MIMDSRDRERYSQKIDRRRLEELRASRNYEDLELFIIKSLMGKA